MSNVLSPFGVMNPSGLWHVRGVTNPAVVCDHNFQVCAAHMGISLASVTNADPTDMEPEDAPAAVQGNFAVISAHIVSRGFAALPFIDVSVYDDPEVGVQYNFELINGAWPIG